MTAVRRIYLPFRNKPLLLGTLHVVELVYTEYANGSGTITMNSRNHSMEVGFAHAPVQAQKLVAGALGYVPNQGHNVTQLQMVTA